MKKISLILSLFAFVLFITSCDEEDVTMPIATATPASEAINSGELTSIALTSSLSGTTFSWTVVQTGVSGATSGSGTTIAQTLTLSGSAVGTATYTVTPMAGGVAGNAITVVITVNVVKITYMADVKPILTVSCAPCHMPGGANPNKWDDYATTKGKINTILDRVKREQGSTGFMPRNGTKLPADKIAILEKWLADGLLEK